MNQASTWTFASPALDHIIERPRLIELIEGADARVVLLVAPAGYGKTTLAKQWSARQAGTIAWYRTTRASGDVGALAVGLDEVLARGTSPKHRDPRRIESIASVNPQPVPLARALVSIYGHLRRDVLLVLDEWEAAGTAEADELIALLVADLGLSILVTSRSRPAWFTSRLEVYGEGLELGVESLAMSDDEAFAVLEASPDSAEACELVTTAGGWPAVLGLAAVTPTAEVEPRHRTSRTLYDYFATEILGAAPEPVQDALRLIAVASIHDPVTAEVVLGRDFPSLLEEARRRALIVVETDMSFSLHPLLTELLVGDLKRSPRSVRTELAGRLGVLIDARCWDEALAAAEVLPEAEFVTSALDRAVEDLLRIRRVTTLERWVRAGRAAGVSTALLDYAESEAALRRGEFDRASILAIHASELLDGNRAANAHLVVARAAHLNSSSEVCASHLAEALRLGTEAPTVATAYWLRYAHGLDLESLEIDRWLRDFQEASDHSIEHQVRIAHGMLTIGNLDGTLRQRVRRYTLARDFLAQVDPMVSSAYLNALSCGLGDCGLFADALDAAELETELADEYGLLFVTRFAALNRARASIGLRRFAIANRALASLGRRGGTEFDAYVHAYQAMLTACLYLSMGDAARAYSAVAVDPDPVAGRVAIAELFSARALAQAALGDVRAIETTEKARSHSRTIGVRAMSSVALALLDVETGANESATSRFISALRSGLGLSVVLGLRVSPALVNLISASAETHEALAPVLLEANDAAIAKQIGVDIPRSVVRSRMLSPRELELHGLIAQGLTNSEIARLLFISQSTVKVHVRHILEKLGARSRAEAARVWQEGN